jgi:yeast amino acid transporter
VARLVSLDEIASIATRANVSQGTGLFVTSGAALSGGGPASLIIAYGIIGILMFCTVQALGELAVLFPVAGSFSAYSTRFLDPAWGFAMGWK